MSTSASTNYNLNAADVVRFALKKLRVKQADADISAEDLADGIEQLNLMLKTWQMTGPHLFRQTNGSLALTANTASFPLPAAYRVLGARFKQNGRELPMELLTNDEYLEMPLKTSTGIPTQYYFDMQTSGGTLYIWPLMAAVNGETIEYAYQRRFDDIDEQTNDIDVPQEWLETVGYSLAERLIADYAVDDRTERRIVSMARDLRAFAEAADREPVFRFEPDRRR